MNIHYQPEYQFWTLANTEIWYSSQMPSFLQVSAKLDFGPKIEKMARGTPCCFSRFSPKIQIFQKCLKFTLQTCQITGSRKSPLFQENLFILFTIFHEIWFWKIIFQIFEYSLSTCNINFGHFLIRKLYIPAKCHYVLGP